MLESIRREDYGFFGPDSPSWKVWASPTALTGFQRAVVLEHFDPFLAAAVADSAGIYTDPSGRLDRTLAYFLTVAVADGRTAIEVSEPRNALPAADAEGPRGAAVGRQPAAGARGNRNPADMDAAHGQLRPTGRCRRRGNTDSAGMGEGIVYQQLSSDARRGPPDRAGDCRSAGPASDRRPTGAQADNHAGRSPRTAGRARLNPVEP
jgi:hypothetical protein